MVEKAAYGGNDITTDPQYDILVDLIERVENLSGGEGGPVDQVYNPESSNAQSGKAVAEAIRIKQNTLVSGLNIKTINGESILCDGYGDTNIEISIPKDGSGENGATFTPNVSADGVISWTNDKGLSNPAPVNIKGKDGYTPMKGKDYNDGDDGYSPTVAVSKSGKVTTINITDKNGKKTATINDGEDGTSVTVKSVTESTSDGGSNIVTFSDGKTVTIKNGSKGDPYTLTNADKQAIVNAVLESFTDVSEVAL
jgi:hypothetical protein